MKFHIIFAGIATFLMVASSAEAQAGKEVGGYLKEYRGYYWKAWASHGDEPALHVAGVIKAGSPGHVVTLKPAVPQGINPRILILELTEEELPGAWPDVPAEVPAVFVKEPSKGEYDQVMVRFPTNDSITLDVLRTAETDDRQKGRTFHGTSDMGDLNEAIRKATDKALQETEESTLIFWTFKNVTGERGGAVNAKKVTVTIEVTPQAP